MSDNGRFTCTVKNNTEMPCNLHPVPSNGNILQNYSTISQQRRCHDTSHKSYSNFICTHLCVCVYACIWVMCILVQFNVCFSSMQFIVCLGSLIQHHRQARHRKIPLSHGFLILAFYSHTSLPLHSLFLTHGNRIVCSPFL